jgi:DNA-binding response OmpR family regulator
MTSLCEFVVDNWNEDWMEPIRVAAARLRRDHEEVERLRGFVERAESVETREQLIDLCREVNWEFPGVLT